MTIYISAFQAHDASCMRMTELFDCDGLTATEV